MTAESWKSIGKFVSINNQKIFVIDQGNCTETLVILHGYPTSSYDYFRILPELSKIYRVIIHDHLGFGFSDKPDTLTYSLIEQADIALQLWHQLGLKRVNILAHDYGKYIAQEILARKNHNLIPIMISKIYLCNTSMSMESVHLKNLGSLIKDKKIGQFIARLTSYGYRKIKRNFRKNNIDDTIQKNYDVNEMWNRLNSSTGEKEIYFLSNYINERYTFWHRWTNALRESNIPIKIFWQKCDPVSLKEIAIVLATENENKRLEWIENNRHFSILESPKSWLKLVFEYENEESPVF